MKEKNVGIEALRLFSILMVIILHVIGKSILGYEPYSSYFWVTWFLEISCYCAVNCFALTSGYVLCEAKITVKRILSLWFQVVFYSLIISYVMFYFYSDLYIRENIFNAFMPVSRKVYWYISCYFILYALMPFLNLGIQTIEKKEFRNILFLSLGAITFLPIFSMLDPFVMDGGYSVIWLCLLYLVGGYIKKYSGFLNLRKCTLLMFFCLSIFITFLCKYLIESFVNSESFLFSYHDVLISYTSITILFAGIFLFCFFTKLNFNTFFKKIILFLSPSVLAVYLIHMHPFIFTKLIIPIPLNGGNFLGFSVSPFIGDGVVVMLCKIFIATIVIFSLCIICDLIRRFIFRMFKINLLCLKLSEFFVRILL